jgi:hypothetical protein
MRFLLRKVLDAVAIVAVALFCETLVWAMDWRGITPLHSTRSDVERLLGRAWHNSLSGSIYKSDQELVEIVYAGQGDPPELCERKVPLNTVLSIFVDPKEKVALTKLGLATDGFKSFKLWFGYQDYRGYYDELSGFVVHTLDGRVNDRSYLANIADRRLCSNYYRNAKHFGEMRYDDF